MVEIYDSTLRAFKESETPEIWNKSLQAFEPSVGKVWNSKLQAWEERWSSIGKIEQIVNSSAAMTKLLNNEKAMKELYEQQNFGLINYDFSDAHFNMARKTNNTLSKISNDNGCYAEKKFDKNIRSCFVVFDVTGNNNVTFNGSSAPLLIGNISSYNSMYDENTITSGFAVQCVSSDEQGYDNFDYIPNYCVTNILKNSSQCTLQRRSGTYLYPNNNCKIIVKSNERGNINNIDKNIIIAYSDGELGCYTKSGYFHFDITKFDDMKTLYMGFGSYNISNILIDSLWLTF